MKGGLQVANALKAPSDNSLDQPTRSSPLIIVL
jgi:hypothetical protein